MRELHIESPGLSIKLPWDKFTARGFMVAMILVPLLLAPFHCMSNRPDPLRDTKKSIPIELLRIGLGDGLGASGGNLTKEGAAKKGPAATVALEDASSSTKNKSLISSETDINKSSNIKPVAEFKTDNPSKNVETGDRPKSIGSQDNQNGSGLGKTGNGIGAGEGFGIEWGGGGGNRFVKQKIIPRYPDGAPSVQIKIKFRVTPEGSVGSMIPMQKGDPQLEREVLNALRRWRFNEIHSENDMEGIITFSFERK